tara:strand:+ start:189 stop:569 length:381 start_codon:yes stop_codon:yes gene_type:complete
MNETNPNSNRPSIIRYYRTLRIQSESIYWNHEMVTERISTNWYTNRYSLDNNKWSQIFKKCETNIVKRYNKNKLKSYFTKWVNILGKKYTKAFVNYAKFYNLRKLPNYIDVKNSSAGIEGWGNANI